MKYQIEQLNQMSKDQLILVIAELQNSLEGTEKRKSRAGVVTVGSPRYVQDYVKTQKRLLDKQRGEQ